MIVELVTVAIFVAMEFRINRRPPRCRAGGIRKCAGKVESRGAAGRHRAVAAASHPERAAATLLVRALPRHGRGRTHPGDLGLRGQQYRGMRAGRAELGHGVGVAHPHTPRTRYAATTGRVQRALSTTALREASTPGDVVAEQSEGGQNP